MLKVKKFWNIFIIINFLILHRILTISALVVSGQRLCISLLCVIKYPLIRPVEWSALSLTGERGLSLLLLLTSKPGGKSLETPFFIHSDNILIFT